MDFTQIYLTDCLLVQLLIIMMKQHVKFYFQSTLGTFIFYSTFLKVEKQEDSFGFQYIPRSRDMLPAPPPAQNC